MAKDEKMVRLQTLWDILNKHNVETNVGAQQEIQKQSLDTAPVKHERWKIVETKIPVIVCSGCWSEYDVKHRLLFNFCPCCGARMDLKARINR